MDWVVPYIIGCLVGFVFGLIAHSFSDDIGPYNRG